MEYPRTLMDRQVSGRSLYGANITDHSAMEAVDMARTNHASRNAALLDSCLIVQIGQRDEQALHALNDRYGALMYSIALQMTQDRELAETVVLDVFSAVWQSANSFQIGQSVSMWLIEMAQHQAVDALPARSQPSPSGA
jgi:hypothetical protein